MVAAVPRKIRSTQQPSTSPMKEPKGARKKPSSLMPTAGGEGGEVRKRESRGKTSAVLPVRQKTSVSRGKEAKPKAPAGEKKKKKSDPKKEEPEELKPPEVVSLNAGDLVVAGNTWTVVSRLGSGGFGEVYKVTSPKLNRGRPCALKTEPSADAVKDKSKLRLKVEVAVLMAATKVSQQKRSHFTDIIDRGKDKASGSKFIVMSLLGPSIDDIRRKILAKDENYSPMTVLYTGVQTLEAIFHLHEIGFLHRDIKPPNFAIGADRADRLIYIFDFGIARRIFMSNGKDLRKPRTNYKVRFIGTPRYCSIRSHRLCEQGRRDDCESWLSMMFDLADREEGLPWKKINGQEKAALKNCQYMKESFMGVSDVLETNWPTDVPECFRLMIPMIAGLEYESRPDYEGMLQMMKDAGTVDVGKLDWVVKEEQLYAVNPDKGDGKEKEEKSQDLNQISTE